jgi:beta-N-acetylhexosaminidase
VKNQLGQLLLIDVPKAIWNPTLERLLQRFQPAGVLFRRLTPATADVSVECARIPELAPFLAIEDEGGGSLSDLFPPLPPLARLDPNSAERLGNLIGRAMALLGLNLNLAPTVDLPAGATTKSPPPPSAPSATPAAAIAGQAEAFIGALAGHRVLACMRHFPGMPGSPDLHSSPSPVVDKPMAALWREDLLPYRTLGAKSGMIQITHAVHKAYDYEFPRPASLSSSVVTGLLRVKLGYQGVVLVDASAAARASNTDLGEAVVRAVIAGCDLVLVPGDEKRLAAVIDSMQRATELGTLSRDRVEEALGRLRTAKKKLATPGRAPSERDLARLQHEFAEFAKQGIAEGNRNA